MIDTAFLKESAAAQGIVLEEGVLARLDSYAALLVQWNEKMNLTAITQPREIAVKHFLDSLLPLLACPIPAGAALIDVGTGAGFPGLPLKLIRPDLHLTLLDSLRKRLSFLEEVCDAVGAEAELVHARAEEAGRGGHRERYDVATARAVAHLRELGEYCLPLVRVGGVFLALKGHEVEAELAEAGGAIALLGGAVEQVCKYSLPDQNSRSIVVIRKISQTPPKYPRPSAKIAKAPLE